MADALIPLSIIVHLIYNFDAHKRECSVEISTYLKPFPFKLQSKFPTVESTSGYWLFLVFLSIFNKNIFSEFGKVVLARMNGGPDDKKFFALKSLFIKKSTSTTEAIQNTISERKVILNMFFERFSRGIPLHCFATTTLWILSILCDGCVNYVRAVKYVFWSHLCTWVSWKNVVWCFSSF